MSASASLSGSCLCHAVRYTVPGPPATVCVCHCSLCRRAVGSPGVAWATVRREGLAVEGTVSWYRSSEHARRGFCGACGTSLFFVTERQPHEVDVTVASLEQADKVGPRYHAWTLDKLAWEAIGDGLPRYREDGGSLPMEVGSRG
ncbi:MAG: GFA family protein [Myxococcales bacterium]|nr:GFA family protein [Myxococcales bacterium]